MYSSANDPLQKGMVKVMLIKNEPTAVNGNITGRMYVFRNINDIHWVDRRDALSMKELNALQIFY